MKAKEWRKEFTKKCEASINAVQEVFNQINKIDEIEGDTDPDEILAFIEIKVVKMNKALNKVYGG